MVHKVANRTWDNSLETREQIGKQQTSQRTVIVVWWVQMDSTIHLHITFGCHEEDFEDHWEIFQYQKWTLAIVSTMKPLRTGTLFGIRADECGVKVLFFIVIQIQTSNDTKCRHSQQIKQQIAYTERREILNWARIDMTVPGGATRIGTALTHQRCRPCAAQIPSTWITAKRILPTRSNAADYPLQYYGCAE